ncbi:hypothetical protein E6P09_14680 [Haloferax mediterranei ATCC 33500]|uniref:Big-1 domain-containing protein n=1 Tax=Haloferax mediterranei (strain ATCC 33500 / DSM 1411 / JCM 8866 / NBRC 14739 / NCIMB 2177 / R-4) TaxID=523841 RepID=I3R798_HALMT|nr:Ig-like domain-containing protein [Haloferax mediterranei]AFK20108.1 hypothetical protein HFX_2423 [Haloferax mediterranei ATCC 33500]AHZ23482.1 hypothetical protein BM92_12900 [Haloferax mediterranei ATCC 33500]ELZ99654.1 hypothetical protein C439_13909 [Haloferax mediterranei ATCC 33500]MDX5987142.1 Ig-like domain-containing protein [Haloferax mediterranei ATCC 33500]QCQ76455.1 hypothetical protein E6P09_14680 [Haloferax mediterranei ATCC 33500]
MNFRGDERAVTVQIGAVLLFGIIIISMSMYQATVVPNQNEQVEFQHNQNVHDDFVSLRGAVIESASEPMTRPATVSLGTRYPSRTLFVNPGPVSGTLQTQSLGTLTVSNVSTSEDETDDYVADNALSFTTKSLEYSPRYHVMQSSPTTVYENTIAYNRFESGYNGTLTGQSLVDGRTISLVLLDGNYSENGVRSATIDAQAVSSATRTVSVTNNSSTSNVTITVPTKLSVEDWKTILTDAEELDGSGDTSNDAYVHEVHDGAAGSVVIEMERGETYNLRVGKIEVGSGAESQSPHYLTVADKSSSSVTFEVRDRYNNPVSGATLNVTALPSTPLAAQGQSGSKLTDLDTDADGQVTVSLTDPSATSYTVRASINRDPSTDFDASRLQNATAEVVPGSGSGSGITGLYDIVWDGDEMDSTGGSAVDYYSANDTLVVDSSSVSDFDGIVTVADDSQSVSNANVDFATNDSTVLTGGLGTDETDGSGVASTTISVSDGVATAYATAGGSSDTIRVKIVSGSGGGSSGDNMNHVSGSGLALANGGETSGAQFKVRNDGSDSVSITGISIETSASQARYVRESNGGQYQDGQHEVYLDASDDGLLEMDGGPPYYGDSGTPYSLGQRERLTENGVVDAGSQATIYIYEFQNNGGNRVRMEGEEVAVTLYFGDGSSQEYTFTATDPY